MKTSKTLKEVCSDLGPEYSLKVIDLEMCIYRDLKSGFDFEISATRRRLGKITCALYIWSNEHPITIVEIVNFKKVSLEQLKNELEKLAVKYKNPSIKTPELLKDHPSSTIQGN